MGIYMKFNDNKNYILQGVILASTALEKYFKALIISHSGKVKHVHFDKFDQLKEAVEQIGYTVIIDKMDPRFIEILTKIYPLRYYDNIKNPISIGFFKNQFLCELDQAVYWFDKALVPTDVKGTLLSTVRQDFQKKNPDLIENNWITKIPIDKKKYMETDCEGYAIYIDPRNLFSEVNVSSVKLSVPYNGSMMLINVGPDMSF